VNFYKKTGVQCQLAEQLHAAYLMKKTSV